VSALSVIPAPLAYTKVVAVKKLVVEFLYGASFDSHLASFIHPLARPGGHLLVARRSRLFTLKKLECLRQAIARIY
jgi:hypothetical protein